MKRLCLIVLACVLFPALGSRAQDMTRPSAFQPEDRVMFDLSAEDWVTTKTAHASVSVEAAVTASTAGATRADMTRAVNDLAEADWRLTSFDRSQDQTGMERWSAVFEARLPETELSGLAEKAKKMSKAGLQLSVANIDFNPTLEETESARSAVRAQIYKLANDQLAALNAALPGRRYRIALINFTGDDGALPMPRVVRGQAAMSMMAAAPAMAPEAQPVPMERSEKITLTARVIFAATPEEKSPAPPQPAPLPSPAAPAPAAKH